MCLGERSVDPVVGRAHLDGCRDAFHQASLPVQPPEVGFRLVTVAWGASAGVRPDEWRSVRPEVPRAVDAERSAVPVLGALARDASAFRQRAALARELCKPDGARSAEQSCAAGAQWAVDSLVAPQRSAEPQCVPSGAAFETVPQALPEPAPARPEPAGALALREQAEEFPPPAVEQPVPRKP